MKGCLLNRKPYTDRNGVFRMRMECCKNPDNCTGNNSPGVVLDDIQRMAKIRKEDNHHVQR